MSMTKKNGECVDEIKTDQGKKKKEGCVLVQLNKNKDRARIRHVDGWGEDRCGKKHRLMSIAQLAETAC